VPLLWSAWMGHPGDVVTENLMDEQRNVSPGGSAPMVQLICNKCRYVALFAME
jgi:hypothetical protein